MARYFTQVGYVAGPALDAFLRSDSESGINSGGYDQAAINHLAQLVAQGVVRPSSPEGQALLNQFGIHAPNPYTGGTATSTPAGAALPTPPSTVPTNTPAQNTPLTLDWTGLEQLPGMARDALGRVPGTPEGTLPTVEMRKLLLDALKADESARLARAEADEARRQFDLTLARQKDAEAAELGLRSRELDQRASEFSQTFNLQKEEAAWRRELAQGQLNLERGRALGIVDGKETLESFIAKGNLALNQQQQSFEEEKYGTALAAKPQNLIESALFQGGRRPGGVGMVAQVIDPATGQTRVGGPAGSRGEGFSGVGGASGIGSGRYASDTINPGSGTPYGDRLVPWAGVLEALRTRTHVPQAGLAQASGGLVTLNQLQNDPTLRINIGDFDQASIQNLGESERGYLLSTLQAQAQDVGAFDEKLKRSKANQGSLGVARTF